MTTQNDVYVNLWSDDWDAQSSPDREGGEFDYINPRILLMEIISEVENNQFRNHSNNKYFREAIDNCLYDPVIKKMLRPDFIFLKDKILSIGNGFIVSLSKCLLDKLFIIGYHKLLVEELLQILITPSYESKNKDIIQKINKHLIVELLFFGYNIKTINRIPNDIFSEPRDIDGTTYTSFPLSCWKQEFPITSNPRTPEYGAAIKEIFKKLNFEDRVRTISRYFDKEKMESVFIVPIKGIKGKFSDFNIGPVNFYSPRKKYVKHLLPGQNGEPEKFTEKGQKEQYLNAAITVQYVDVLSGAQTAKKQIELAFDLLKVRLNTNTPFEIQNRGSLVVDKEGRVESQSWSMEGSEYHNWLQSFDADKVNIAEVLEEDSLKLFNEILTGCAPRDFQSILCPALHWIRKAQEASNELDKILFYWISVEKFSRFPAHYGNPLSNSEVTDRIELTREIVGKLSAKNFFFSVGWSLFYRLKSLFFNRLGPKRIIPDDLARFLFISPEIKTVFLKDFLSHFWEREKELNIPELSREVVCCRDFYTNPKNALSIVEKAERKTKNNFTLFYRARNQIVHDGEISQHLVPFYLSQAREISFLLFSCIHTGFCRNKNASFEEIFLKEISKYELIRIALKEGIPLENKLFESA